MEGKQIKVYLNLSLPLGFFLSTNSKHYSNTAESIKLINGIIIPYTEKERISLNLPKIQPALLIMDVFVVTVLNHSIILLVWVPANITHIFQLLDLTVNETFGTFMHKKFPEWCSRQILHAWENGCEPTDAKVNVKLTNMKPLNAK